MEKKSNNNLPKHWDEIIAIGRSFFVCLLICLFVCWTTLYRIIWYRLLKYVSLLIIMWVKSRKCDCKWCNGMYVPSFSGQKHIENSKFVLSNWYNGVKPVDFDCTWMEQTDHSKIIQRYNIIIHDPEYFILSYLYSYCILIKNRWNVCSCIVFPYCWVCAVGL